MYHSCRRVAVGAAKASRGQQHLIRCNSPPRHTSTTTGVCYARKQYHTPLLAPMDSRPWVLIAASYTAKRDALHRLAHLFFIVACSWLAPRRRRCFFFLCVRACGPLSQLLYLRHMCVFHHSQNLLKGTPGQLAANLDIPEVVLRHLLEVRF